MIGTVAARVVGWVATRTARGVSRQAGAEERTAMLAARPAARLDHAVDRLGERALGGLGGGQVVVRRGGGASSCRHAPWPRRATSASWSSPSWSARWYRSSSGSAATEASPRTPTRSISPPRQRFAGGQGDPNYLAAGLVAAIALAGGLLPSIRDPIARLGPRRGDRAIAVALAATESRGGLIWRAWRSSPRSSSPAGSGSGALSSACSLIAAAAAFFLASPSALDRVTSFNAGGNGRTELWKVGMAR